MGCFLAYEAEIPGISHGVGLRTAHFANASISLTDASLSLLSLLSLFYLEIVFEEAIPHA